MSHNIIFLLAAIPVPLTMLIVGALLWKNPPEPGKNGYRSKYSYSSIEAWYFAQVTCGKLAVIHSILSLIGTVIAETAGIVLKLSENQGLILFSCVTAAQIAVIFADNLITEHRLRRRFNPDGTAKQFQNLP